MGAAVPVIQAVSMGVGALSTVKSLFGSEPEAPSLPAPPPQPDVSAPPPPTQVGDKAKESIAQEQAKSRDIRRRRADTRRRGIASLAQQDTLLGE